MVLQTMVHIHVDLCRHALYIDMLQLLLEYIIADCLLCVQPALLL